MSEIAELERRLASALDRIGAGVAKLETPAVSGDTEGEDLSAKVAELETALASEKEANAQLEERVKALKDRQDHMVADLSKTAEDAREKVAEFEASIEALRESNADLSETNDRLRTALAASTAEPELINRAMQAELDALRAVRRAETAEVGAILAELKPIVEEAE